MKEARRSLRRGLGGGLGAEVLSRHSTEQLWRTTGSVSDSLTSSDLRNSESRVSEEGLPW